MKKIIPTAFSNILTTITQGDTTYRFAIETDVNNTDTICLLISGRESTGIRDYGVITHDERIAINRNILTKNPELVDAFERTCCIPDATEIINDGGFSTKVLTLTPSMTNIIHANREAKKAVNCLRDLDEDAVFTTPITVDNTVIDKFIVVRGTSPHELVIRDESGTYDLAHVNYAHEYGLTSQAILIRVRDRFALAFAQTYATSPVRVNNPHLGSRVCFRLTKPVTTLLDQVYEACIAIDEYKAQQTTT